MTLSSLLPRAAEGLRSELDRLRRETTTVCQRLARQAERNLVAARQGLALIRDVLGESLGSQAPVSAYDRHGLAAYAGTPRGCVLNLRS